MSGGSASGASAIYAGAVVHTRLRPVRHRLRQRVMLLLLDLDELPALAARLRLFGLGRAALFRFRAADHLGGSGDLAAELRAALHDAGIADADGAIRVLCMPRQAGAVFNPLSLFFCHAADGTLRAILYEVNNTFGQRHTYVAPVAQPVDGPIRQACAKRFHVSPFMDMALTYHFRVQPPAARVGIGIEVRDAEGLLLSAAFAGERRPLSDAALLGFALRNPLPALAVLGGIHWHALQLWLKGMRLRRRPPAPTSAFSIATARPR